MDLTYVTRDIATDKYGDILFDFGDIVVTEDQQIIGKCNSMHRVFSAYKDMRQYPLYGASLEEFIGKRINDDLLRSMENRIKNSLTEDKFLSDGDLKVIAIPGDANEVLIKISFTRGFYKEVYTEFNISIDIIDGTVYVF